MKIFIFTILPTFIFAFSVNMDKSRLKCNQILNNIAYSTCFNYKTRTPLFSYYKLNKNKVNKKMKRYNKFLEDKRIPKKYRVKSKDYRKSGYNRGHLAPNAIADWNFKAMKETFLLTNIAPQVPKHNMYGWKSLETIVRNIVNKYDNIEVITGIYFTDIDNKIKGKISIPQYWYKVVYIPSRNLGFAILTPNKSLKKSQLKKYLISINELEEKIGITFFSNLNNVKQNSFKKTVKPEIRKFFN